MLKPLVPYRSGRWSLIVVVRVTTHCPLACRYCGYSRQLQRQRGEIDWPELVRFGQLLQAYHEQTDREILVCWLGGEPFLWPRLWPATEMFRQAFGLSVGITTSGINLHQTYQRYQTLRWVNELTISVDGPAEHHDRVRNQPGGYRQLRETIDQLNGDRTGGLLLRANMVLTRGNIDHFAESCRELSRWGVDEVSFNQLGGLDRPEFYPNNRLTSEQVQRFCNQLPALRAELATLGTTLVGAQSYLDRIAATARGDHLSVDDCRPGTEFWFIDELGRLSPCSYTSPDYGLSIAQLTTVNDLSEIPDRLRQLRAARRCAACDDCHATHHSAKFDQPAHATA